MGKKSVKYMLGDKVYKSTARIVLNENYYIKKEKHHDQQQVCS